LVDRAQCIYIGFEEDEERTIVCGYPGWETVILIVASTVEMRQLADI
jgi:hypothetical protein